ncbi:MAG: ORF6N domain-containing protein [Elusimicrobia bacterium]|nr:ORF6N domain-containing protein [Elusimicrobiota bacterium]
MSKKQNSFSLVKFEDVANKIIEIRGEKVILDSDVAELYGVETREINQALSNNPDKFPWGYVFELTKEEKKEVIKNFDYLANLKFSPHLPKAFTEKGMYMLATILKSPRATQTTMHVFFQELSIHSSIFL